MDFTLDDAQTAITELTGRIVGDHCDSDRLRDLDRAGIGHDRDLWNALADADLIGIGLPETVGGGGLGLVETCLVAEAVGRGPGSVPLAEAAAAGRALGRCGADRALTLAHDLSQGDALVVPALREGPTAAEVAIPDTVATRDGEHWRLRGEKRFVSHSIPPNAYLVSACTEGGTALFVAEVADVAVAERSTTTTGGTVATVILDGAPATLASEPADAAAHSTLLHELRILRCAHYAGVAAGALHLAAEHAKSREQFRSPIGTFQAVAHRLADAWLDVNLMQSTYRQAAWRSDHTYPAEQATASAALWACEGGQRVVHAAQHIHGGVGMDLDYPVHRFFRWAKEIDLALGGAGAAIEALGTAIATEPLTIG